MIRIDLLNRLTGPQAKPYIADNFSKYTTTGILGRFLARYELSKLITDVRGSICECGLKSGTGLLQWWHISKLLDPHDIRRLCFGFDTFTGFPAPSEKDGSFAYAGQLSDIADIYEELLNVIELQERTEFTVQSDPNATEEPEPGKKYARKESGRLVAIKGDFMETGPKFMAEHPHLILAMLFLDFDLYEPTKLALELFLPRMPKGAIIAFDELNNLEFPGETLAAMETIGIRNMQLKKFSFDKDVSYVVLT